MPYNTSEGDLVCRPADNGIPASLISHLVSWDVSYSTGRSWTLGNSNLGTAVHILSDPEIDPFGRNEVSELNDLSDECIPI